MRMHAYMHKHLVNSCIHVYRIAALPFVHLVWPDCPYSFFCKKKTMQVKTINCVSPTLVLFLFPPLFFSPFSSANTRMSILHDVSSPRSSCDSVKTSRMIVRLSRLSSQSDYFAEMEVIYVLLLLLFRLLLRHHHLTRRLLSQPLPLLMYPQASVRKVNALITCNGMIIL